MSNNFLFSLDNTIYHDDLGISIIEGWAYDPETKEPVNVEINVPSLINSVYRVDLNRQLNMPNQNPYGFFIRMPGDFEKLNPTITFSNRGKKDIIYADQNKKYKFKEKLGKLKNLLSRYELLIKNNLTHHNSESVSDGIVKDELQEWMDTVEESKFSNLTDFKSNLTYIIRTDTDEIGNTVESIKNTNPEAEILIVSDQNINLPDYKVFKPLRDNEEISISELENKAIEYAHGDYIVFIDNKDKLAPQFYNEINTALEKNPNADFIYSDSDLIYDNGVRYELDFKPDYDETLLLQTNYILNPVIVKKDLLNKIGGFRKDFEGLKDYDLILRATKEADNIIHIPKILYHWNKRTDNFFDLKRKDSLKGVEILKDYLNNESLDVIYSDLDYVYSTEFKDKYPSVTIICGVLEGFSDKRVIKTLENIINFTQYPEYNVVALNTKDEIKDSRISYQENKKATSQSELYNQAAENVDSEYLLFVNPSFRGIVSSWLTEMIDLIQLPNIGIVGPKIFNSKFTYESLGTTIDDNRQYAIGNEQYIQSKGLNNSYLIPKEVFSVANGALLIKRKLFEELGGFDCNLSPANQFIDLSIRARKLGLKTVNARNTPVIFDEINVHNGENIIELTEKFSQDDLIDHTVNENIKPSGSAAKFIKER